MEQTKVKILLTKFLENKCTDEELISVREIMQLSGTNEVLHEIMLEQYGESWIKPLREDQQVAQRVADLKTKVFNQITGNDTIHQRINSVERSKPIPFIKQKAFWRKAAIWLLVASGMGIFSIRNLKKITGTEQVAYIEKYNPYGTRSQITLPDSSVVYLGGGSKIRFREDFIVAKTRDIELEGEAYFEIVHHAERPFLVHTGDILTKDVGTSFKITSFKNKPLTIEVASGEVSVKHLVNEHLITIANLTPGKKITWGMNYVSTDDVAIIDISGWKDGRLAYDGKPLEHITADLERWYNVKFSFDNKKLAGMPMTITLMANAPINKILEVLSVSGQFKYEIKGKNITIKNMKR